MQFRMLRNTRNMSKTANELLYTHYLKNFSNNSLRFLYKTFLLKIYGQYLHYFKSYQQKSIALQFMYLPL